MDLLSQGERDLIRAAIYDVTDTFCKTPVSFFKQVQKVGSDARWGNADINQFVEVTVNCYVTYSEITTFYTKYSEGGARETFDVECMMNLDQAVAAGLAELPNKVLLKGGHRFKVNGVEYYVTDYRIDGNFERKGLIFTVIGLQVNKANVN